MDSGGARLAVYGGIIVGYLVGRIEPEIGIALKLPVGKKDLME